MSDRELSPLEALLTGRTLEPDAAPHDPLAEPEVVAVPVKPVKARRRADPAKVKELHEMVLNRDRRLNGRCQHEFEFQLQLDWEDISAVFGEYPEVMRFNQHSRLWSIHPDAES